MAVSDTSNREKHKHRREWGLEKSMYNLKKVCTIYESFCNSYRSLKEQRNLKGMIMKGEYITINGQSENHRQMSKSDITIFFET